jgi:hypothetical protein
MQWADVIGLGVAGNFTGHLEQAGEASDFVQVHVGDATAPKGIFPFYVPAPRDASAAPHFLHRMPISSHEIILSSLEDNHQIEPELSLYCALTYRAGKVVNIRPTLAMAHNDCSIRRPGAKKISEKKNWGPASKGVAKHALVLDRFSAGGVLDHCRLASYLLRDGVLHAYGQDSAISAYSYFYETLLEWLTTRLNTQQDEGPLEDIPGWLEHAGYPQHALISVGATRYTAFGETHFLQPGDRSIVVLYDQRVASLAEIEARLMQPGPTVMEGLSVLDQRVSGPSTATLHAPA